MVSPDPKQDRHNVASITSVLGLLAGLGSLHSPARKQLLPVSIILYHVQALVVH